MEENRNKTLEVITLECEILEQHLKWEGIPLYVYISALAALIWAVIQQDHLSLNDYGIIIISSSLATKIIWTLIMGDLFGYKKLDETHVKFLNTFSENIKIDCGVDILINSACLVILFFSSFSERLHLKAYFGIILLYEVCIYIGSRFWSFNIPELDVLKSKKISSAFYLFINIILFSTSLSLIYFQVDNIHEIASFMEGNSVKIFKVGILFAGIILLTKYFIRGTYFFTALSLKKNEKLEFIRKAT